MDSDELLKVFGDEMRANLKDFEIVVRLVSEDEIVKSHRGKMVLLVQELKINNGDNK